ncbi:MAG: exosortase/archaeosortase family protein [Phycisphaerae bacterium]|nr:exosortase/archaeosortase family protein [Phycisphaerae bacterium]
MTRAKPELRHRHSRRSVEQTEGGGRRGLVTPWLAIGLISATLLWAYWPTIVLLVKEWHDNDDYSVGQLVPLVALYLVWQERRGLRECVVQPCWWGLVLIFLAEFGRAYGLVFMYESAERYALVLMIVGLTLLLSGWQVFYRARWILLFLFLMVPLPGRIHNLVSGPLQNLATVCAGFTLELLGVTAVREGNVLVLNGEVPLAVAEACSGLRMLTAFVVVASTLAFVIKRPRWQKATLVVSSVPVAIVCNLARLVTTALLYLWASSETAERFFHDFAGLTMMPLAVFILVFELWLMSRLVVEESHPKTASR